MALQPEPEIVRIFKEKLTHVDFQIRNIKEYFNLLPKEKQDELISNSHYVSPFFQFRTSLEGLKFYIEDLQGSISPYNYRIISAMCCENKFDKIEYLINIGIPIDWRVDNLEIFRTACMMKNMRLIEFLHTIVPHEVQNAFVHLNNELLNFKMIENTEMTEGECTVCYELKHCKIICSGEQWKHIVCMTCFNQLQTMSCPVCRRGLLPP